MRGFKLECVLRTLPHECEACIRSERLEWDIQGADAEDGVDQRLQWKRYDVFHRAFQVHQFESNLAQQIRQWQHLGSIAAKGVDSAAKQRKVRMHLDKMRHSVVRVYVYPPSYSLPQGTYTYVVCIYHCVIHTQRIHHMYTLWYHD